MAGKSSASNRSQSKGKTGGASRKLKHTYLEMVQIAIITLNERGGSSRQEIWKCIESKFPEANLTSYMIALKKMSAKGGPVLRGKNMQRYTLEKDFKRKAVKRMAQGKPIKAVLSTTGTVDRVKKAMKKNKPAKKDKKKAKKDGKKSGKAGQKAAGAKAKKGAASKTTKDKIKEKAKENRKTGKSKDTKAKIDSKRAKGDKKVAAATKANTNKAKKEKDQKAKAKSSAASKRQSKANENKKQPPKSNRQSSAAGK